MIYHSFIIAFSVNLNIQMIKLTVDIIRNINIHHKVAVRTKKTSLSFFKKTIRLRLVVPWESLTSATSRIRCKNKKLKNLTLRFNLCLALAYCLDPIASVSAFLPRNQANRLCFSFGRALLLFLPVWPFSLRASYACRTFEPELDSSVFLNAICYRSPFTLSYFSLNKITRESTSATLESPSTLSQFAFVYGSARFPRGWQIIRLRDRGEFLQRAARLSGSLLSGLSLSFSRKLVLKRTG